MSVISCQHRALWWRLRILLHPHKCQVALCSFWKQPTLTKGASAIFAIRLAISVLPQPVGPIMRMFLGTISACIKPLWFQSWYHGGHSIGTGWLRSSRPFLLNNAENTLRAPSILLLRHRFLRALATAFFASSCWKAPIRVDLLSCHSVRLWPGSNANDKSAADQATRLPDARASFSDRQRRLYLANNVPVQVFDKLSGCQGCHFIGISCRVWGEGNSRRKAAFCRLWCVQRLLCIALATIHLPLLTSKQELQRPVLGREGLPLQYSSNETQMKVNDFQLVAGAFA